MARSLIVIYFLAASSFYFSIDSTIAYESPLGDILRRFEEIKQRMCYHDSKGLPQLEPLILSDKIPLDVDGEVGSIQGHFNNTTIIGLSNFIVRDTKFDSSKVHFSISLPEVTMTGKYSLKGNFGGLVDLDGADKFLIKLNGLHITAGGDFHFDKLVPLKNLKLDMKVDSIDSRINGLANDHEVNTVLNEAISHIVPKYFEKYHLIETKQLMEKAVEDALSNTWREVTVTLLSFIQGVKSSLPPLDLTKACQL